MGISERRDAPAETSSMWRSLAEYRGDDRIDDALGREFPPDASVLNPDETSRREFLKTITASLAMLQAAGCVRQPEEAIVPAAKSPEILPDGRSLYYATALPMTGGGSGVLVKCRDGRPLKIEGNDLHPTSLGATDAFSQAAILDLYNPDRSRVVRKQGRINHWAGLLSELALERERALTDQGQGLRILSPPILSPTLAWQRDQLLTQFPKARWHIFDSVDDGGARTGARLAFRREASCIYHLDQADVILSIEGDVLGNGPGHVRYARDFSKTRRPLEAAAARMSRLYAVESTLSLTGAAADHRLALSPQGITRFVITLARKLGVELASQEEQSEGVPLEWWQALLEDLGDDSLRRLVIAGDSQPAWVHAVAHAINDQLGAVGTTVTYAAPANNPASEDDDEDADESLAALLDEMQSGGVKTLLILDGNPVFTAPADLAFGEALAHVERSIHLGFELDETAERCTWHVPAAHPLESWGDVQAFDGTTSIIQPVIAPLHGGRTPQEILNVLLGEANRTPYDTVRTYWREEHGDADFETFWEHALHDGVIPGSAAPPLQVALDADALDRIRAAASAALADAAEPTELVAVFRPHPTSWDGRFADNAWLQELPQPFTKLTWGNAALLGPATAARHGMSDGDVVEVAIGEANARLPVMVVPGQADGVVALHFGCGRRNAGRIGKGVGVNLYPLRRSTGWWTAAAKLARTETTRPLATTQQHFLMDGRDLVKSGSVEDVRNDPQHPAFMRSGHAGHSGHGSHEGAELPTLYPDMLSGGPQWGMSINLGSCLGCSACVVACQAENNIPTVGEEQVLHGREMHWLRIDTYYDGAPEQPAVHHQPVPCMHCEHAPCELVCPVAATTHSPDGLNEMTYNRCIGTRYCSNNCPYKVRRFNFLDYRTLTKTEPSLQLLQNPDVSVRSRGVMEKCTYCVQRIEAARIEASIDGRPIRDGEVVTACQAVCPTQAIVFGDIHDPDSAVSRQKASPLNYGLLEELNTRPRTTYLASVKNPHPLLARS